MNFAEIDLLAIRTDFERAIAKSTIAEGATEATIDLAAFEDNIAEKNAAEVNNKSIPIMIDLDKLSKKFAPKQSN